MYGVLSLGVMSLSIWGLPAAYDRPMIGEDDQLPAIDLTVEVSYSVFYCQKLSHIGAVPLLLRAE